MASNKKTTEPIFSNATEMMWFQDRNCQYCAKYTQYNEKLGKFPQFRCAVQRDMEGQAVGIEEVSQRSYDACQSGTCPFLKRKDGDVEVKHTEVGTHIAPKSEPKVEIKAEAPINILEQAEKMRQERIAKAEKEERSKVLGDALTKMHNRRLASTIEQGIYPREKKQMIPAKVYINKKSKIQRTDIPEDVRTYYEELGVKIKDEGNRILAHHMGLCHLVCRIVLDTADGVIQDCIREYKAKKIFKHALKKDVNIARKNYDRVYNLIVYETRDITDYFNATLDYMADELQTDIQKMYFAIKNVFDKYKLKDSAIKARSVLVLSLLHICTAEHRIILDRCKTEVHQIFRRERLQIPSSFNEIINDHFFAKDPEPIEKAWQKVAEGVCNLPKDVDEALDSDPNVILGIRILSKKFIDVDLLERVGNKVAHDMPDSLDAYYEIRKMKKPDNMKIVV